MTEGKKSYTPIAALKAYFGYLPNQTTSEFLAEVRQLSTDERLELAGLACAELGAELNTDLKLQ